MTMVKPLPAPTELELALRDAQSRQLPFKDWPRVLKLAFYRERKHDAVQELRFQQALGLAIAFASVLLEITAVGTNCISTFWTSAAVASPRSYAATRVLTAASRPSTRSIAAESF